ncbi:zincin-like metallopeptidase domain-containing protein [Sphingomonas xinjiangensis]|uniref:zincin-like metallopeptidase domain-containing protein n=1 Tax=Sphingomonas xinjiangensis TaxID=643568 RepID=UPI001FEBB774|nr:zincin-like metallopeptidase domain-containing protein [Sphingomonas xinjiangensis]
MSLLRNLARPHSNAQARDVSHDRCFTRCPAHETAHWSGGSTRLDRTFGKRFGDNAYAVEELVAELSTAMICAELGLPTELHEHHAS